MLADRLSELVFVPLSPSIGAEARGIDLSTSIGPAQVDAIRAALMTHGVLFFRDQHLTSTQFRDLGRAFGDLEILGAEFDYYVRPGVSFDPACREVMRFEYGRDVVARENFWHFDLASTMQPSAATMLIAREIPSLGGDTLFTGLAAAYERLDDKTKQRIEGLIGLHDFVPMRRLRRAKGASPTELSEWDHRFPLMEFPIVRQHPITRTRVLWACETYTIGIKGMEDEEAALLLRHLAHQIWLPENQCRFRWTAGAVALWDNTACQHYAARDYWPERRVMERMTLLTLRAA